jgi:hypothetical protein
MTMQAASALMSMPSYGKNPFYVYEYVQQIIQDVDFQI